MHLQVCRTVIPDVLRRSLSSNVRPPPSSPWEQALANGRLDISVDHMDGETSEVAMGLMMSDASIAQRMLNSADIPEDERAQAQLVVDQFAELRRVHEMRTEQTTSTEQRLNCFWLSCG